MYVYYPFSLAQSTLVHTVLYIDTVSPKHPGNANINTGSVNRTCNLIRATFYSELLILVGASAL